MSDSLDQHRMMRAAEEIATKIDPQAGGFFRKCLIRAAVDGMGWAFETAKQRIAQHAEATDDPPRST